MQRGNSTGQREQTESHDIKQKRQFSAYKCGVLHVLLRVQTYSVWVSWPDCVFKWKAPSVWKLAAEMITDSDDTRWFPPDWGSSCNFTVCVSVCVCGSLEMYLCYREALIKRVSSSGMIMMPRLWVPARNDYWSDTSVRFVDVRMVKRVHPLCKVTSEWRLSYVIFGRITLVHWRGRIGDFTLSSIILHVNGDVNVFNISRHFI